MYMDEIEKNEVTPAIAPAENMNRPLWESQRALLLTIAMFLFTFVLMVSAIWKPVDQIGILAFGGIIGVGFAYFFGGKSAIDKATSEAKTGEILSKYK